MRGNLRPANKISTSVGDLVNMIAGAKRPITDYTVVLDNFYPATQLPLSATGGTSHPAPGIYFWSGTAFTVS